MTDDTVTTHRLLALTEAARGAFTAGNLRRAEAAVTGMRHVLERHPDVSEYDSWVTLHQHLEDKLDAAKGHRAPQPETKRRPTMTTRYDATRNDDGSVSYWSVTGQCWETVSSQHQVPSADWPTLDDHDRGLLGSLPTDDDEEES